MLMVVFHATAQPQNIFYRAWVQNGGIHTPSFAQPIVTSVNGIGETYIAGSVVNTATTLSMSLTKYSSSGTVSWNRTFDVNTVGNSYVGSIALDPSGNVLVAGSTYNGTTNNYDLYVVKYNSSGTKQWHQLYNGAGNSYDFAAAVKCSSNGDVFVTGGTFHTLVNLNAVTIRYNSSGTAQWTQTWDNVSLSDAGGTIAFAGAETRVIITGFTQTNASTWEYMALTYAASNGTLAASSVTTLGGTSIDRISDAVTDSVGNIYITGTLGTTGQGLDMKTVKLDVNLNILWTATWNGSANLDDAANGLVVDASGNVYVAGSSTNASNTDAVLIKYTSHGTTSWVETHDGGGADAFADVALTNNGAIFVGGHTSKADSNKDFYVALYSSSGTYRWSETYNGLPNRDEAIQSVNADGNGNFLVSGPSEQWDSSQQLLTAKYAPYTQVLPQNEGVNAPFIEYRGQVLNTADTSEDGIRYYSQSTYPNLYIFDDKVSFVFSHIDTVPTSVDTMARFDLFFKNSRSSATAGLERQVDFHNYYLGHIPEGRERVPLENKVLQPGIYANIDALYGQGQDGFFLRLICKPGSNPADIKLQFKGHTGLFIQTDGSLRVESLLEDLILPAPSAVLSSASGVESAASWTPAFVINGDSTVSVTTGSVTSGSSLILKSGRDRHDPDGECDYYWSTYFGEAGNDIALGSDVDDSGNMYFTGHTTSNLFPYTLGAIQTQLIGVIDAYVACFKQLDEQKWATYYGGTENAPGENDLLIDQGLSIKWNSYNNKVYFIGRTSSPDFPLLQETGYYNTQTKGAVNTWSTRGFIVKLKAEDGKLDWATFFGDKQKKYDAVTALDILYNGNVMVGGYSFEQDNTQTSFPFFPNNTPGLEPHIQTTGAVYIAEFSTANAQIWATKLTNEALLAAVGSTPCALADIADDGNGSVMAVGHVFEDASNDFIPMGSNSMTFTGFGGSEVFILKFSNERKISWSSYLGGSSLEYANSVVCPSEGSCYVTGTTFSTNFPAMALGDAGNPLLNDLTLDGDQDIFVSQFNSEDDGSSRLAWARYLGGSASSVSTGADGQSNVNLSGINGSTGNGTSVPGQNELAITGQVETNFSPLTPSTCPYYHGTINNGGSTTGSDAIMVLFKNREIKFSTYWGGDRVSGSSKDMGITISNGISSEGKKFVLLGGETDSKEASGQGKTIPVCRELPFSGSYYKDNFLGGFTDGFISKVYYGECMLVGVSSLQDDIQHLDIQPNPATDFLSIILPETGKGDLSIVLFDATGKVVATFSHPSPAASGEAIPIDIASLPLGLYYVMVNAAGRSFSGKFVKM